MVNSLRPTVAKLLFEGASREFQPPLIEIVAQFVGARHPDHHRGGVGHETETVFALSPRQLGALGLCDIGDQGQGARLSV